MDRAVLFKARDIGDGFALGSAGNGVAGQAQGNSKEDSFNGVAGSSGPSPLLLTAVYAKDMG